MKQIFLTVFMVLFAVNISANTSCKVEGSSNNNVATLGESYYHSGAKASGGNKCFVRTSVTLAKPSLGETVIVIEVFDQYNQSVGNTMVTIDEGNQYSGEIRFKVNNSSYDGVCGEYRFTIASATCQEKKKDVASQKTDVYTELGWPSTTIRKNSNSNDTIKVEKADEESNIYRRRRVITLLGYLHIFPYELGMFDNEPTDMIRRVNNNTQYEYNTWRIPTKEEITVIKANGFADQKDKYMTRESKNGRVLLVTDTEKAAILKHKADSIKRVQRWEAEYERERKANAERQFWQHKADSLQQISGFVDLGLPSGTMWNAQSEPDYYTFNMANMIYSNFLPTEEQLKELKSNCTWHVIERYNNYGKKMVGWIVTGPNNKSIYIEGSIISSTPEEVRPDYAYALSIGYNENAKQPFYTVGSGYRKTARWKVRLVKRTAKEVQTAYQNNNNEKYIDLGLKSGTKWSKNLYRLEENISIQSDDDIAIPTQKQWKELQKQCTWETISDFGYKVTGPNGNYIFISNEYECYEGSQGPYREYLWRSNKDDLYYAHTEKYPLIIADKKIRFKKECNSRYLLFRKVQ